MILEFQTQAEAATSLAVIHEMAAAYWQSQGYTVLTLEDGTKALVSKNAKTGEDEPNKTLTVRWDFVKESPDGTFYFSSLSNNARFYDPDNGINWKTAYEALNGPAYTEREFPEAWRPVDDIM